MKSCNLLQLQREQLRRKAEFEEQGKVDLREKPVSMQTDPERIEMGPEWPKK